MNTFLIIFLAFLAIVQIMGMVWAWRYLDSSATGDSEYGLFAHLLFSVFWPISWAALLVGRAQ